MNSYQLLMQEFIALGVAIVALNDICIIQHRFINRDCYNAIFFIHNSIQMEMRYIIKPDVLNNFSVGFRPFSKHKAISISL